MRFLFTPRPLTILAALTWLLWGRTEPATCDYHPWKFLEENDLSAKAARRASSPRKLALGAARSNARDVGNIAVLEDSGGVVSRRNPFNLSRRKVIFDVVNAEASAYRFRISDPFSDEAALVGATGENLDSLGDDDSRSVPLPFPFPFFGQSYNKVFVNSDGNLTFTEADSSSRARSLGRLLAGPPRISPLFTDLDPSKSPGSVKVTRLTDRIIFSWVDVAVYTDTGLGARQTFEVMLWASGRIEMTWLGITSSSAVVGIAPGGLDSVPSLVAFAAGSEQQYASAVAERFGNLEELDLQVAAQQFYQNHEDSYDYLVFFNNINVSPGVGVLAFANPVRDVSIGNGAPRTGDSGALFGSKDKLKAVLHMGTLDQYPVNPNALVPARFASGDTSLTILGHEAGHLFLAYTSVRDSANATLRPMLGRSLFHWNFFFNSEASLLEGNRIADFGEGVSPRFATTATVQGYSSLDQYLMGLRPPEQVAPTFLVEKPDIPLIGTDPRVGVRFNGNRREVKVEEIIGVEGPLKPDHTVSQRQFRFAFVLIVKAGAAADSNAVQQLETLRSQFELAFDRFTEGRAQAVTSLSRNLRLSIDPYAGVPLNKRMTASLYIDVPQSSDLDVGLVSGSRLVGLPEKVVIPAGSRRVDFEMQGNGAGVDQITATVADRLLQPVFRPSIAKVQILERIADLLLKIESGDKQVGVDGVELAEPLSVQLTDGNGVPYPGRTILVKTAKEELPSVVTNEKGRILVRWTPGPGPNNQLTFTLEESANVTVSATTVSPK